MARIPPPGWGKDELSNYLETARQNQFATFANMSADVTDLACIDAIIIQFAGQEANPVLPALLLMRAHATYRVSSSLAMAGQLYEVHAQHRSAVESVGYAMHIGSDLQRAEAWMRRHDSDAHKKAVRQEFAGDRIKASIGTSFPALSNVYSRLYDDAIDYGAHPNERGFSANLLVERVGGSRQMAQISLQSNPKMIGSILRRTAQVGIFVARAIDSMYPGAFSAETKAELATIMKRY